MGSVIAVVNSRKTVGRTAVACNLACSLTRLGKRVLFVDMDPQSDATRILFSRAGREIVHAQTIDTLIDPSDDNNLPINEYIRASPLHKKLFIIPNKISSLRHEISIAIDFPIHSEILRDRVFSFAKENFDYTIMDTPPNLGMLTIVSLCASEIVCLPVDTKNYDSVEGLPETIDLIDSAKIILKSEQPERPDLPFFKILLNRVHHRRNICGAVIGDITNRFEKSSIFETVIPDNEALRKAMKLHKSIFAFSPTSLVARAFRKLALEVIFMLEERTGRQNDPVAADKQKTGGVDQR